MLCSKTKREHRASNTRLNSQDDVEEKSRSGFAIAWDWYQMTGNLPGGEQYAIFDVLEAATGEKLLLRPGKPTVVGVEWQNSGISPMGVKVAWDNQDQDGNCRVFIAVPGKVLSKMTLRQQYDLAAVLIGAGLQFTRADARLDDYDKTVMPANVISALQAGNYTKFQRKKMTTQFGEDWCINLGSAQSARSSKYYNKEAESKGEIKAWRWETRFAGKLSQQVILKWLSITPQEHGDAWERKSAQFIAQSIIGSVDFIDRVSKPDEKNISRIPRLGWWKDFIGKIGKGIYHVRPVVNTSLEKTTGWMKRAVFRSLACVLGALGKDDAQEWFMSKIEEAGLSLNERHIKLREQFAAEYQAYKWAAA